MKLGRDRSSHKLKKNKREKTRHRWYREGILNAIGSRRSSM